MTPLNVSWYNYRTSEYENIPTPEDFEDYLPQDDASQNMFDLLWVNMGRSKIEACNEVLSNHIEAMEGE